MRRYRLEMVPEDGPFYDELVGALDEAREQQRVTEHFAMVCAFLMGATAALLVLTWSGRIVI